jgi:hypothetical protein
MNKYFKILKVYLYNPAFAILAAIFFMGAIVSRIGIRYGWFEIAEDTMTMLFVFTAWLLFLFGVIVKRQFANHRASLLPNYRGAHLAVMVLIYLSFLAAAYFWEIGVKPNPVFKITSTELVGIYLSCLFMSLLIVYFGYLSIGMVLFLAYFVVLVLAGQTQSVIDFLGQSLETRGSLVIGTIVVAFFFVVRLLTLKEGMFEYSFLFSWPQRDFVSNQLRVSQVFVSITDWFRKILGIKERVLNIPVYPHRKGLLSRALHWDYIERSELKGVLVLLVVLTPGYLYFVAHYPALHKFYKTPYLNFLLYAIAPVLITICGRYKQMAYLGYDLLKPIRKSEFMKERGIILGQDFLSYWLLFVMYFAVLPNKILMPEILGTVKLWNYLLLTFGYGFLTLAWIAYMATLDNPKSVIINGISLCILSQMQFMGSGIFTAELMAISAFLSFAGAGLLTRAAYKKWCQMEF